MEENNSLQLPSRVKRILWIVLAVVLVGVAIYAAWYIVNFRNYDGYKDLMRAPAALETSSEIDAKADERVPGFKLAAENDTMALLFREDTAEVAVLDKRSGRVTYSNPQDAASDPVARSGINQENLKSQFILTYLDANAKEGTPWSSYGKAVANGQVEFERLTDGLRVIYTLSNVQIQLVPAKMTQEWFDIIANAGKKQAAKSYERDEESGLYKLKTQGVTARHRQQIDQDARKAGFTLEDYEAMEALVESEETEKAENLTFEVTLDWKLTADGVQATIPYEGLGEFGGGQIRAIQLLPFFGAANASETGDLVLPDGSGAVIHFNNGKAANPQYNQAIYDLDLVDADYTATQNTLPARLALFGICRGDGSILATCERGSSLANVVADVAGRNNSYNYAYFTFNVRRTDTLIVVGEEAIVAERDRYPVDCTVRYTLLGEDYLGYSGIARAYRERLIAEGKLTRKAQASGDIPFYYDVIGGVKETAHWMGVQYLRVLPMTTFAQAEEILMSLKHEGISNQRMNLQGWMNGGYYHDAVNNVRVLGQLGGESALSHLIATMASAGGTVYPDVQLQFISDIAKGFHHSEESSRYYAEGYVVELGVINPISYRRTGTLGYRERGFTLLSPKFLPRYAQRLTAALDRLKLSAVSLRDLGSELHADKRRTNVISREADKDIAASALGTIGSGRDVMITGGNDYALPYAAHVLNAPVQATLFPIVDEEIPLWEMIVHGSLDYAGSPINMAQSQNRQADLLRLVEYGAAPHYTFTARDAAEMKYTGLNGNFATTFTSWKEQAVEDYCFLNGALSAVSGQDMVAHERLSATLAKVTYSGGTVIYVNRGEAEAQADGQTVPAMSYLVTGGEAQ